MTVPPAVADLLGRAAEPGLESTLTAVRLGILDAATAVAVVPGWPLLLLADRDAGGLQPLIVRDDHGSPLIAAFTSPDRVRGLADPRLAPVWVRGATIAAGARHGAGMVINPGSEPTLTLDARALRALAAAPVSVTTAPVEQPPGSRALTAFERTILSYRAAATPRRSVTEALADATLILVSSRDPAAGDIDPATADGGATLLAWTGTDLIREAPEGSWLVRVRGRDASAMVRNQTRALGLDPGSAFEVTLGTADLTGV